MNSHPCSFNCAWSRPFIVFINSPFAPKSRCLDPISVVLHFHVLWWMQAMHWWKCLQKGHQAFRYVWSEANYATMCECRCNFHSFVWKNVICLCLYVWVLFSILSAQCALVNVWGNCAVVWTRLLRGGVPRGGDPFCVTTSDNVWHEVDIVCAVFLVSSELLFQAYSTVNSTWLIIG